MLDQITHISQHLTTHHPIFDSPLTKLDVVEQVNLHLVVRDDVLIPLLTEIVNDQVMRDTSDPRLELTILRVSSLLNGHDHLDKGLLENILRQLFVAYHKIYIRMNAALVTIQ